MTLATSIAVTVACVHAAQRAPAPREATAAAWERAVGGDVFENRGVARVEQLGTRWVLTVLCSGTHSTYLDDTTMDLRPWTGRFVSARYRYVMRAVASPRCVAAPCDATERRIALDGLTPAAIDAAAAEASRLNCNTQR